MKKILSSAKEYFAYLIVGVMTTLVNYVIYFVCQDVMLLHYIISNGLAFAGAVLFAYAANKRYVFRSDSPYSLKELFSFVSLRIVSLIIETVLLAAGVEWLQWDDGITKIAVSVITVVLNYIFGKYITFARKEGQTWR